jgi:O-methyltransferase
MSLREMINLYNLIKKTLQIDGDIAEVGVFKGGSAKIICEVKENKKLHLFDTFKGLPPTNSRYDTLTEGIMHETSLEQVKNYLSGYKNVYFYQGIFPDTAKKLTNTQFSFVNLDVDIYESTKKSLEFFYPRLNKGGIILTHDYNDVLTPGVKIAFNDFFTSKPEQIIELWDTQAMIIKI